MIPETLISMPYLREQVILHGAPRGYGGKGGKWTVAVWDVIKTFGITSVLDYGCGQSQLGDNLRAAPIGLDIVEYDPAVRGKDLLPNPADLVVCTDVIEHIEPEKLDAVLAHLRSLTLTALFVVIATRPSNKTLTDGRNAHLILADGAWWQARLLSAGFRLSDHVIPHPLEKPSREWKAVLLPC